MNKIKAERPQVTDLLIRYDKKVDEWVNYFGYTVPEISTPVQLVVEISRISKLYHEATVYFMEADNISTQFTLSQKSMLDDIYTRVKARHVKAVNGNTQRIKPSVIRKESDMEAGDIIRNLELYKYETRFWSSILDYLKQQMELLKQISVSLGYNIKIRERIPRKHD